MFVMLYFIIGIAVHMNAWGACNWAVIGFPISGFRMISYEKWVRLFFYFFLNWQFSKSTNVYKSSSFVKLFCGLKKKKFMYFVLLGTKAQYISFGPFEETRFDTGICTDNLIAMQTSLLIFNIVLSYKPSFCHWYQYTNATNHLKRFLKI